MKKLQYLLILALIPALTSCGGDSLPTTLNDAGGSAGIQQDNNNVPSSPAAGESRSGQTYSVYIDVPETGETVAFTVFEPTSFVGGQKYPLILYGHGGGEQRVTNSEDPSIAFSPLNNPKIYRDAGYGVISMDQSGHGESTGTIRLMDPDVEGQNLLALLDWAEAELDWLAYGPSVDGSDPNNLKLGAIGGSYGGGFQMLIHNIDPKHRLDAIIPETTWHELNFSMAPNSVFKTLWSTFLFLRLNAASNEPNPENLDPFVQSMMLDGLTTNQISQEQQDFLSYHSNAYFCNGQPLTTTAGAKTTPLYAPTKPGKINALFIQGMRDTLFNLNEAWLNYQCYAEAGGDVRLMTYHFGHNATPVVPDPGIQPTIPGPDTRSLPFDSFTNTCGPLTGHEAGLAFMDEHVKGIAGAASVVPEEICLSLSDDDGVLVNELITGQAGTEKEIPATTVINGVPDVPIPVVLDIVAGDQGDVVGGIPHVQISITPASEDAPGDPVIFIGVGVIRAGLPDVWTLIDNQVTPIRGTGDFDLPLVGIGERLAPGDQLVLLMYGGNYQYALNGAINLSQPTLMPVTVEGKVWMPMLGPVEAIPAP